MKMNHRSLFVAASTALALGLTACSNNGPSNTTPSRSAQQAANAGNFTSVYFLGDSLTAGFQSDSLIDTSQPNGWANLTATQIGFPIALPLIASPGAPNQLTLVSLNPLTLGMLPGATTGRDDFNLQPTDVAVPGFLVNDVLNTPPVVAPATGQEAITQLVLGFPGFANGTSLSAAQQAAAGNPTTIFLWIGNNDALVADETGLTSSMTPLATFTSQYQALITYLQANTNAHLIIANIPDVTAVPYLTPAPYVLAQVSAETGVPTAELSAILGIGAGDLVNPEGTSEIPAILQAALAGKAAGPISDAGFLSAAEVVQVQTMVTAYNSVIAASAKTAGATTVDINGLFAQTTAKGIVENGIPGTTTFLGGVFSLDGIHPTNTGYAVVANAFIDSINSQLSKTYPEVNVPAIAAKDPLYPPYPGHHLFKGQAVGTRYAMPALPPAVRKSLHELFGPKN